MESRIYEKLNYTVVTWDPPQAPLSDVLYYRWWCFDGRRGYAGTTRLSAAVFEGPNANGSLHCAVFAKYSANGGEAGKDSRTTYARFDFD